MKRTMVAVFSLCICCSAGVNDAIGSAYANGEYLMSNAPVRGTATLFDGVALDVGDAPTRLLLNGRARVWLAPHSQATVFADHVVLRAGSGQMENSSGYFLQASPVQVAGSVPGSVVRIIVRENGGAVVVPIKGGVSVTNEAGLHIADLAPGASVRFAKQAGDARRIQASGCLDRHDGEFTLVDGVTHVRVALNGSGLAENVGRMVQIAGVASAAATSEGLPVVAISTLQTLATGECPQHESSLNQSKLIAKQASPQDSAQDQAKKPSTTKRAAKPAPAGRVTDPKIAILGGVSAAAVVVGDLAAAGAIFGGSPEPSVSR